jgi:hypothetical protein
MKKYLIRVFVMAIGCQICTSILNAQIGTWAKITNNAPNYNQGVCLLLTDGTVMCHNATGGTYGTGWDKLTPDIHGSYVNGTWTTLASMHNDRFAFSSQVLPNGNVWVAGGEYGAGDTAAEVYNPLTNTWTIIGGMPTNGTESYHTWNVYDAPSELLYTGVVLDGPELGHDPSYDCLFYTPSANRLTVAPSSIYDHDEAQWIKLPDSSVLFIGIGSDNSNRYIPQTNTWVRDGNVPVNIYDRFGEESGCGLMLPNGQAIFFGAAQYNAFYTPTGNANPGTWTAAAEFPMIGGTYVGQPDAPGAMMVNGHILLAVSPIGTSTVDEDHSPIYFLEYDYTSNTFVQVTSIIPGIGTDSIAGGISQFMGFLDLPDGNVLVSISQTLISNEYWIYTPGSAAIPQGKPTINSIIPEGCQDYKITGKLFNGISEGASFGDDWQMATNYPIIRLTNGTDVFYARTTNWNRIGALQTDSLEDTAFLSIPSMPGGTYSLVVVANGFASNPVLFQAFGVSIGSQTNILCHGGSSGNVTAIASGGVAPYTYSWSTGGNSNSTASNLSAGTYSITVADNNGCSSTTSVTLSQPTSIYISTYLRDVSTQGACDGLAAATGHGGTGPYTYLWNPGGLTTDTIKGLCTGSYCCKITDAHGCIDSDCVAIVTGIENIEPGGGHIIMYPNPSNGKFTMVSTFENGELSVEFYNVLGQNVESIIIKDKSNTIDLSPQPAGVYFYRAIKEDGSLAGEGKFVIEK